MAIIKNPLTLMKGEEATLIEKSITSNGTYKAEDDNADGYSQVTVNVSGGGGSGEGDSIIAKRIIRIPKEYARGVTYGTMFSHYVVLGPAYNPSNLTSSTGNMVVLYDLNTKQVVHTYEYSNRGHYYAVIRFADKGYIVCKETYTNSNYGSFFWIYNGETDTWYYYDNDSTKPYVYYREGSCFYQGKDFGLVQTTAGSVYCVKLDGTVTRIISGNSSSNSYRQFFLTKRADNGFIYLSFTSQGTSNSYGVYQKVGVVRMQTEGYFYDIKEYQFATSTSGSYRRNVISNGRYVVLYPSTASYSSGISVIDMGLNTPTVIKYSSTSSVAAPYKVGVSGNKMFTVGNTANFYIDVGNYSTSGDVNDITITIDTTSVASVNRAWIINGRFFVGSDNAFIEITSSGVNKIINTGGNTSISEGVNTNDVLIAPVGSTGYFTYVYHTLTNTYETLKTDTSTQSYFNSSARNWFTSITNVPEGVYVAWAGNSQGCIIYLSQTDTYYYIRTSSASPDNCIKRLGDDGIYLTGMGNSNNIQHGFLITKTTVTDIEVGTGTIYPAVPSYVLYVNNKYYIQYQYQSPVYSYILECDTENNTISIAFSADSGVNLYAGYFGYDYVETSNYVYNPNMVSGHNNGTFATKSGMVTSPYCLVMNKSTGVWTLKTDIYSVVDTPYSGYIVFRPTSNGTVQIMNETTGVITDTGYTPANNYSWKCMPNGVIIIKTTTAVVKYDIRTSTATTLATGSNNSTSNNYGTIRVLDNIALVLTVNGGWYDSDTDTWTSTSNSYWWHSSYYNYITFVKTSNGKMILHLGMSNSNSCYGAHKLIDPENPSFNLSIQTSNPYDLYGVMFYDSINNKYYWTYHSYGTSNTSTHSSVDLYIYDVETDTQTIKNIKTSLQGTNYMPAININGITNNITVYLYNNYNMVRQYDIVTEKGIGGSMASSYSVYVSAHNEGCGFGILVRETGRSTSCAIVDMYSDNIYGSSTLTTQGVGSSTKMLAEGNVSAGSTYFMGYDNNDKAVFVGIWAPTSEELGVNV